MAVGGLAVLTVVVLHAGLFGRYRPVNVDDAWTLSWADGYVNRGTEVDEVFYGGDGGGVRSFGKIYGALYGRTLNVVGWTRANAHRLSLALAFWGAACWMAALRRLGYSRRFCGVFGFVLVISEPFVGMAHMARVDALVFLLGGASLLALTSGFLMTAGWLAMLGIENHPIGIVAVLVAGAVLVAHGKEWGGGRRVAWMSVRYALGGLLGLAVYLALHHRALANVQASLAYNRAAVWDVPNYLFHYFFRTRYLRHLPELALIVVALGVVVRGGGWRRHRLALLAMLAALASTVIVRRPNFHYAVFAFPSVVLLWCVAADRLGRLGSLAILMAVLLLPQYAWVVGRNRDHSAAAFQARIQQLQALVPPDDRPVAGSANGWFAFRGREYVHSPVALEKRWPAFYLVEEADDEYLAAVRRRLKRRYDLRALDLPEDAPAGVALFEAQARP